jgi:hypothetical protein
MTLRKMITWCYTNIGPRRPYHPLHEAEEGNIRISFWFASLEDRTLFNLTWGGNAP